MGFFFRKSIDLGPFRINLSKSGVGFSIGTKGYRTGVRSDGRRYTSASVPGTGFRYLGGSGSALGLLAALFGGSDDDQDRGDTARYQRRATRSASDDFDPADDEDSDEAAEAESFDSTIQGLEELVREQDRRTKAREEAVDPMIEQLEELVREQDRKTRRRR